MAPRTLGQPVTRRLQEIRAVRWFLISCLLLIPAFVLQNPYVAFAVYSFLLLVLIAHVSSLAWLAGLDCERSLSVDTVREGEYVDVAVEIRNRRGWPIPWIYFEDNHPKDFPRSGANSRLAILMPGRSVTLNYTLQCPRRGYHCIGPVIMESGDLFGLQRRFRTGRQQNYVSVLPTVAYIDTFNVSARRPQGPVRVSNRIYEDPTRIAGLREYAPGDPMRMVHWKASARTGELFVKTHEPATVLGGTVVLDLHKDSYFPPEESDRLIELAITTTASISYLLQLSGEQVGMLTNARDAAEVAKYEVASRESMARAEIEPATDTAGASDRLSPLEVPTARSPLQAQRIAESLAHVVPTEGLTVDKLILAAFQRLPRDAALLPVVPCVDESLALTLASMKLSGFSVSVFLVGGDTRYQEAAALLAPHNIYTFHIEDTWSLYEISPARIGN